MSLLSPTLQDLPTPPNGKTGWPWTIEGPHLPNTMPDGQPWPRISVVTPSFNQGQFLEETIRSVLLQGYPNLEYIVIDGASTDQSVSIIKKYADWLAFCSSEPDHGQSHALNKGFARATGAYFGWLNSDDYYLPNILNSVAPRTFSNRIIFANSIDLDEVSGKIMPDFGKPVFLKRFFIHGGVLPSHCTFWPATIHQEFDQRLHFSMDWDLWYRICRSAKCLHINRFGGVFRAHNGSKTAQQKEEYKGGWEADSVIHNQKYIIRAPSRFEMLTYHYLTKLTAKVRQARHDAGTDLGYQAVLRNLENKPSLH